MNKIDIVSLSLEELEQEMLKISEKKFRAKQVYEWLHIKNASSFNEMTNISKELRIKLDEFFCIKQIIIKKRLESSMDNTVKYLYELEDGNFVETVLMNYNHGNSICVSTQVGCKMGCKFCASAIAGYVRNLTPSEMLAQVYFSEKDSEKKISRIVLMGIGEPLDNFENVIKFINLITDKNGHNISQRHVTLSTCGLIPEIIELANIDLNITLSISLHATTNKQRNKLMPVNTKYNLEDLMVACKLYSEKTKRRITFEYAVISKVNSSYEDALMLSKLIKNINAHVNLIAVNTVKERDFYATEKSVKQFKEMLEKLGVNATLRRKLGTDINAACGQLRREESKENI